MSASRRRAEGTGPKISAGGRGRHGDRASDSRGCRLQAAKGPLALVAASWSLPGKTMSVREQSRKPIRVLVVDDHPLLREGIAAVIGGERDIRLVTEARDGRQAGAAFRT